MHRLAWFAVLLLVLPAAAHSQWDLQTSNTTADLRGIHSIGNGVAWASGTNGTVLRTEDSGYVWQSCSLPPGAEKLDFRGIQAFDANTAIVMSSGKGDLSRLYKTTDGCHSWKLFFTNPDPEGFWDAIAYNRDEKGRLHGWILGDPVHGRFRVFRSTSEDGEHFQAEDSSTLAAPSKEAGVFAASNSSFYELQAGPELPTGPPPPHPQPGTTRNGPYDLQKTPLQWFVTGGKGGARVYVRQPDWMFDFAVPEKWISYPLPLGNGLSTSGAFSIAVHDLFSGVIVGGDYAAPDSFTRTAAYRNAKSQKWSPAITPPHGYRSSVAYDAASNSWITVGPNGTDLSSDDGRNWRPLRPDPGRHEVPDADRNWNAISLPFVVGPHGRIGKLNAGSSKP